MELGVQILVAVAAMIFIIDKVTDVTNGTISQLHLLAVRNRIKAVEHVHEESHEAIKEPFELWWEDGPKQTVTEKFRADLMHDSGLEHLPMELPPELIEMMVTAGSESAVEGMRDMALHLAVHAHMGDAQVALLKRLPKFGGLRRNMLKGHEEHKEELEAQRRTLLDYGINPTELESYFAKQA